MVFQNISLSARAGDIIGITGKTVPENLLLQLFKVVFLSPKGGAIRIKGEKLDGKRPGQKLFDGHAGVNHQLFSDSVKNECPACK